MAKTLDQRIAALDAERIRLLEKKRRADAHRKIVMDATCLSLFRERPPATAFWEMLIAKASAKDRPILEELKNEITHV